jgi:hypothetical protein
MVAGVCCCCGYLAECVEFRGPWRSVLICPQCRAAAEPKPMLPIAPVPRPKPPAREVRRFVAARTAGRRAG